MKIFALSLLLALMPACRTKNGSRASVNPDPVGSPIMETNDDKPAPAPEQGKGLPAAATVDANVFDCDKLDYGIYWFGKGDVAQKAEKGTKSAFFDPKRPTFLYIHGWQARSHKTKRRPSFNYRKTDPILGVNRDAADAWVDAGWNVGIFYWSQFADEDLVRLAEDKIWNSKPLTWRRCDGNPSSEGAPGGNVSDLLFDSFVAAMEGYSGPNIRIAGHSLGNQLATRLADRLSIAVNEGKLAPSMRPKRVALLDPFWTMGTTLFEGRAPIVRPMIERMVSEGVIFERYKTSDILDNRVGDQNQELTKVIGETEIFPDYYSKENQAARHLAAPFLYFLSFGNPAPRGCVKPCNDLAPSAATSDERMLELMKDPAQWVQLGGRLTPDTADNAFIKK